MPTDSSDKSANSRQLAADLQIVHDSMLDGLGQLADYFGFNKVMGQLVRLPFAQRRTAIP